MSLAILKALVDAVARGTQYAEHAVRANADDVVLEGFDPAVQLSNYSCGAQSTFMKRWGRWTAVFSRTSGPQFARRPQ